MINPVTLEDFKAYFNANWNIVPTNNRVPLISYWNDIEWSEEDNSELVDRWFDTYKDDINGISIPLGDGHNPLLCCAMINTSDLETIEKINREFPSKVTMSDGTYQYLFYRRCSAETLYRYDFQCPSNMGSISVFYFDCHIPLPPSYAGPWKNFKWSDESFASLLNTPTSDLTVLDHKKVLNIGRLINSPTVDSINIDLPNDEQFNGRLNRKDSIDSFLGKIYRRNSHNDINDTVSQVLDFDLNNYPKASFFLGAEYKSLNREANALIYVAKFNLEFVNENGVGAAFNNKIEDDGIRFNALVPITEAHSKVITDEFPVFNRDLIPPIWRSMVDEICESEGIPHQAMFACLFAGLGACAQGNTIVRPKSRGHYERRTNLAIALVANSGSRKSDVIRMALREINKIDDNLSNINSREDLARVLDTEKRIENLTKEKGKNPNDLDAINAEIFKLQDELKANPLKGNKFVYGNATVQKMIRDAKDNQAHGLLMIKDEMKQLFADMSKKGNEDYRNFYMHGFDGNGLPYKYSTIGSGEQRIDKLVLSMISGVQPDVLSVYINQLYSAFGQNDGFLQRIILVPFGESIITDENELDFKKFVKAYDVFNKAFGKENSVISVHEDAMKIYDKFLKEIKIRAKNYANNSPLASMLSKHQGYLSSMACIYEIAICEGVPISIGIEALTKASLFLEYLAECAKYLFKVKDRQEDQEAVVNVARMLKSRHFVDGQSQSQWHQTIKFLIKDPGLFYNALHELQIRGYVCLRDNRKGSVSCWINPQVNLL